MTIKHFRKWTLALALGVIGAGVALAAVDFDDATGKGFVGKGDVQLAFEWNNKQLQDNASEVTFTYQEEGSYTLVCSRIHPQQGYQEQTFPNKVIGVASAITYDTRKNSKGQITGFELDEFGDESVTGEGCPSGFPNEVSRTANEDPGAVVGLFVHYGSNEVQIWPSEG